MLNLALVIVTTTTLLSQSKEVLCAQDAENVYRKIWEKPVSLSMTIRRSVATWLRLHVYLVGTIKTLEKKRKKKLIWSTLHQKSWNCLKNYSIELHGKLHSFHASSATFVTQVLTKAINFEFQLNISNLFPKDGEDPNPAKKTKHPTGPSLLIFNLQSNSFQKIVTLSKVHEGPIEASGYKVCSIGTITTSEIQEYWKQTSTQTNEQKTVYIIRQKPLFGFLIHANCQLSSLYCLLCVVPTIPGLLRFFRRLLWFVKDFRQMFSIYFFCVSGRDVYVFGGEYLFGYGDWQTSVWRWDSFRDLWHIETKYYISSLRLEF